MAIDTLETSAASAPQSGSDARTELGASLPARLRKTLLPLASLKFTVALFVMAIFIVLAGTFAQWQRDINQVIDDYFRVKFHAGDSWADWFSALFVRIDFQIFFPPSFFPSKPQVGGGFFFPKGWLIGVLMAVNLLAAHTLRFKLQAAGARLLAGLGLIAVGVLVTWAVIASGSNPDGLQQEPWVSFRTLWNITSVVVKIGLLAAAAALIYFAQRWETRQEHLRRLVYIAAGVLILADVWLIVKGDAASLNDSSMRILWLLVKATLASCVLLAGCIMLFKKRAGIVLLHAGIGLLMFNELLVGTTHKEARMSLQEGETVNYVSNLDALEIAIVDASAPEHDRVVAVPLERLTLGETLRDEVLPFDIKLERFYANSRLKDVAPGEKTIASTGGGKLFEAEEVEPVKGTDVGGEVNMPAIYVQLVGKDGEDLGLRLLAAELAFGNYQEEVTVAKKKYDVALRFERTYKPYSLHLIDVRKDDYIGTSTVRNYSSDVRLVDPTRNVDREIRIWMNNPLRFAGETFYQSGYHFDPRSGTEFTTLQVVTNNGWMIPYVSCMIVVVGMLGQFGQVLLRFLKRREREAQAAALLQEATASSVAEREPRSKRRRSVERIAPEDAAGTERTSHWAAKYFPAAVAATITLWLLSTLIARPSQVNEMDLKAVGELPLAYEGRIKPLDTLARTSLRQVSGKQTFKDDRGEKQPAIRWLLDLAIKPQVAREYEVLKIDNPEVLQTLDLLPRKGYLYSIDEIEPRFEELKKQTDLAHEQRQKDKTSLSVYQRKILELEKRIGILTLLLASFERPDLRDPRGAQLIAHVQSLMQREPPLLLPPLTSADKEKNLWQPLPAAVLLGRAQEAMTGEKMPVLTQGMLDILNAYENGETLQFNNAVANYRRQLEADPELAAELANTQYEAAFNAAEPFYHAMLSYGIAFVLAALALLGWSKPLNRAAFWLMVVTFIYHTGALYARMEISGRPPVTNLYSSAIFIGWGCVALGLVLETAFRIGIGNLVASITGVGSLMVAHMLTTMVPDHMGDTMNVMQAVLDTQFWLATHVVCITFGYATTFLAGFLGVIYVGYPLLGKLLDRFGEGSDRLNLETGKLLVRMIYGTICFALVFSFFGTVLGGLWADDSWGRFWGWDPKENGALIIVLWNALVLHARWDGMVKDRGLAALAIGGNIVTAWSWFGVNELGVGMHSYGFTDGVLLMLALFVASQLVVVALAALPGNDWRQKAVA